MNDNAKNKMNLVHVQIMVLLVFLALNGFLYYMTECSNEYLQSRDVWGNTQTVSRNNLKLQQQILEKLPEYSNAALAYIDEKIKALEKQQEEEKQRQKELEKQRFREEHGIPTASGTESGSDTVEDSKGRLETEAVVIEDPANYRYIRQLVEQTGNYEEYIKNVGRNAQSMAQTSIFDEGWLLSNITKCQRDFYGLDLLKIRPVLDYGVNVCLNYRVTDVLVLCMAILTAVLLFLSLKNQDYTVYMHERAIVIKSTVLLAAGIALMYGTNWFLTQQFIICTELDIHIQSLSAYSTCMYVLKLGSFLGVWLLIKLSACLMFFMVMTAILMLSRKLQYLFLGLFCVLLFWEYAFSQYDGIAPLPVFLREINLISAFHPERFFNRYINLNIAGSAVSRLAVFLPVWLALFGFGSYFAVRRIRVFCFGVHKRVQTAYYEEVNQRYQETRQMWHDFHNHLLAIQALNESGDREGASRYVRELTEQIDHNLLPVKTGCNPVDLLLFKKNQLAVQQGVRCRFAVGASLAKTGIAEFDLCSILGNLLDNALEASAEPGMEERVIELAIRRQNEMLYISCSNPYKGERIPENGQLATTKADKSRHGIGLASVSRIARKYHGIVKVQTENQIFQVQVLLNDRRT